MGRFRPDGDAEQPLYSFHGTGPCAGVFGQGSKGKERIDEIENPELAMARMQELYEKKGYPKTWIDKRLRGIAVRQDLTDEWKNRGAKTSLEYAILTNEIMQGTFGLKVEDYKQVKALARENLRDHMIALFHEPRRIRFPDEKTDRKKPCMAEVCRVRGAPASRDRRDCGCRHA
jgi:hypothetical protein